MEKNTEKNTVILDLVQYNELREFKEQIEKNNVAVIPCGANYNGCGASYNFTKKFITTDEAVKEISKENENLLKIIETQQTEINKFKFPNVSVSYNVDDIKKFTV